MWIQWGFTAYGEEIINLSNKLTEIDLDRTDVVTVYVDKED